METIASHLDGGIEFRFALPLLGDDVDAAADGRIAIEDAVRTANDLDSLDAPQGELHPVNGSHVRPVYAEAIIYY